MEDLLVHSTKCPFCGRTFERIEEAIQKEKEIWRPWDEIPTTFPWNETINTDSWTNSMVGTKIYDYPRVF